MYARQGEPPASPEHDEDAEEQPHAFDQFIRRRATAAVAETDDTPASPLLPKQPRSLLDVGLSKAFLTDLALKILHYSGTPALTQLIRRIGLGPGIVQQVIASLAEERLVEVMSQSDLYTGNYRYRLTERGTQRVAQALERSRYAGPCPVTAEQYSEVVRRMHAHRQDLSRTRIKSVLNELVLAPEVSDSAARALYSGKAALFYGPSGNGKTSMLEGFASGLDGFALVPYAIYAYGQTIRVFDQSIHEPVEEPDADGGIKEDTKMDRRWVLIRRPAVILGAEMAEDSMDLAYDPTARFYQAPPHIKAQGGVLVIDDFGRQRVSARDVLTRLMIPIERGWDTLSMATGEKLTVPFSVQLLLGTNIGIKKLADDSLLRRVLYKVEVPNPEPEEFTEIVLRVCQQKGVAVTEGVVAYAVSKLYAQPKLKVRASYARDLVDMLIESASFDGHDPVLTKESFERVFRMFLVHESEDPGDGADD
jgi:DNA-binding MarR family transcriptional regulator